MYHESASMIEAMQIDAADLFAKSPYANFLYAVNMSIIKEYSRSVDYYKEARALYIKFTKKVPLELAMWQEYNDYKRGIYHNEIPVDEHLAGIVVNYPDSLYWKLVLADLEIYLQLGNLKRVEQVLENTRTPTHRKYADFLNYYAALYYKKKGNLTRAQEYLGNLERYSKDNRVITLATLERTRMLYDAGAISLAGAIQRLDSIRYHWRGDKLEYELLTQLADYYEKAGEVLLALRTYKYIKDAFANKINDLFITGQMVELYNKLFVHGRDIERLSDFEVISIFYEFKFLNPIGADGDDVILMIAKRMMNLDLLDNAISLLQHQVQYRLKGDKRVITAEHLATLYLMNDMPQRAIDILQNTDRDNIDFNRHIFRSRLKASAYAVLGRYSEALTLLEGDNSEHANSLRYDIFFRAGKWNDYIKGMEASILTKLASGEKVEDIDLIKIAVAYTNSGKFRALKNLRAMLKEPSTTVKAILDLLLLSNSPVDMGSVMKSMPIEKVPAMLQQYKSDLF